MLLTDLSYFSSQILELYVFRILLDFQCFKAHLLSHFNHFPLVIHSRMESRFTQSDITKNGNYLHFEMLLSISIKFLFVIVEKLKKKKVYKDTDNVIFGYSCRHKPQQKVKQNNSLFHLIYIFIYIYPSVLLK